MKKLLIFDLDGTLLYTLQDLSNAVNAALSSFNFENKSVDYVRRAIGNGVAVLISRCIENGFDNPKYDEVLKRFREYYFSHFLDTTYPYDGVLDSLIKLKQKGYKLAVVTNKIDHISKELINHFFPNVFDMVQGDVSNLKKKPSSEMVDYVLDKLNIDRKNACYIGDTNVDYETAINSKMDVLLVTYGFRNKDEMRTYNFDCPMVSSPKEIYDYFK